MKIVLCTVGRHDRPVTRVVSYQRHCAVPESGGDNSSMTAFVRHLVGFGSRELDPAISRIEPELSETRTGGKADTLGLAIIVVHRGPPLALHRLPEFGVEARGRSEDDWQRRLQLP